MYVTLTKSTYFYFGTTDPTTGEATNADSLPTVSIAEDGTTMGYSPTVSNVSTGIYKVQVDVTSANGFEAGKSYSLFMSATVGGVTGKDGLSTFEAIDYDMNTILSRIDVAISSRLATAGYTSAPTVGEIRTELSPELALINLNLDVKVSEAGGGLTEEQNTKLMSLNGVGFINNSRYDYGATDRKMLEEIKEELKKPKQEVDFTKINKKLNEIVSQNDIAKTEIIDTIKASENEVCSDIIRKSKELKEDNVKTRNLVRKKTEKINKKLDIEEVDNKEGDEILEILKEMKEESDDKDILDFLDQTEAEDIETLLT